MLHFLLDITRCPDLELLAKLLRGYPDAEFIVYSTFLYQSDNRPRSCRQYGELEEVLALSRTLVSGPSEPRGDLVCVRMWLSPCSSRSSAR